MTITCKQSLSAALLALMLATTASAQEEVNIYSERDHIDETTLADFQEATGIKPIYYPDDSVDVAIEDIDLLVEQAFLYNNPQTQAGALQKLDKSLLPNWKNLDPLLLKHLESIDPGNQYLVPYLWEAYGIGYNPEKVKAALDIDQIDSWSVLFEPENIEKLIQCGVVLPDFPETMIPAMLAYLGFDPNSTDLDDYKKAEEKFIQISKHVTYRTPFFDDIITDLANGNICITAGFSQHVMEAAERAIDAGNGIEVHYAIPKEGADLYFEVMGIPVDAPNAKAAHAFINYLLDPGVIAKISGSVGYANANLAAREFMDKDIVEMLYPPQAVLDKAYISIDLPDNILNAMRRSWAHIKSGTTTASEQEVLYIYNSSGYIGETTLTDFQKATGIKPAHDTSANVDKLEDRQLYGVHDLLVKSAILFGRPIKSDALQKLDKSLLPNWKNLSPLLLKRLESSDPGNQYLVPYLWKAYGISYNPEKIKAALGIDKIDSWNVLFEPENIEKLSQCGVALLDSPDIMIPAMLAYLGFAPNSTHPDDLKKAEERFIQIIKHVTYLESFSDINRDLAKGNICIAGGILGHLMQADNGIEVHHAIPKEGAMLWFEAMAIPSDTPNTKAVHAFINYLLEPEVIAKISDSVGYANPNLAARELMDKRLVENPWLYPPQAVLDKTYVSVGWPENIYFTMAYSWKRIKSAK